MKAFVRQPLITPTKTCFALATSLLIPLAAMAQAEDCTTVLARVDAKIATFAPDYLGAIAHGKALRDKGAKHCEIGEKAQALDALKDAELIADKLSAGG